MPPQQQTENGVAYDPEALDRAEQHFWGEIWEAVPEEVASEHGLELRRFGSIQASIVRDLPDVPMLNLVLGATEDGPGYENLAAAVEWTRSRGVSLYVPVTPGLPGSDTAAPWLREHGFEPAYAWMKFVRDAHEPRFAAPEVEVVELTAPEQEPFGMIAAAGFELPAWGASFFAQLPGRTGWRCYVARIEGKAQACAAMLVGEGIAEFGVAATLEGARGRGCQLALLHRRIRDAAEAGCHTLFVETGERVPARPSGSYRNILRAGFEEAYLRPNWRPAQS
jgi:GNAT superfamily N-acetyltransferase